MPPIVNILASPAWEWLWPWLDLSKIENPTQLNEAVMSISTLTIVLGLMTAAACFGCLVLWKKVKVIKQYAQHF